MSKVVTVLASGYLLVCGLFAADSEATAEQAAIAAPPAAAAESTLRTQAARPGVSTMPRRRT